MHPDAFLQISFRRTGILRKQVLVMKRTEGKDLVKNAVKGLGVLLLTLVFALLLFLTASIWIIERGPSEEIRDMFVVTVQQTSAAKPLAGLFLSKEEVESILEAAKAQDDELETDPSLIRLEEKKDLSGITIEDVQGPTYKGKMMIVEDPSRVYVGTLAEYETGKGMTLSQIVEAEDAIGGINGGGFSDAAGLGNGDVPLGIVISRGEWRNGSKSGRHKLIGIDGNNRLVIGNMTGNEAIEKGIRDAVAWGPALIVNGEAVDVGKGGGLNPRTAIGQRADGAMLLLVVDGRQPSSMGATYLDLIGIMEGYGAVNAANLDGGNSSSMVYEGKTITTPASLFGEREIPTFILVEKRD